MEFHPTWIQELRELGKSYNYEGVVPGAKLDLITSADKNAFMASLLLVYTMTEHGHFEDSLMYLKGACKMMEKVDDKEIRSGCEYLCKALANHLYSKQGTATHEENSAEFPAFEALSDKAKAVVYVCKGYALSRWEPEILCLSMVEAFDKAVQLDPRICYYRVGQALALGRQRRQLSSTGRSSNQESVVRIKQEREIWEHCVSHGDDDEKLLAKCFIAFLTAEMIHSPDFYRFPGSERRDMEENMATLLDEIYQSLNAGTVVYDKFVIAKRAAMSYVRGSKIKRWKQHFLSRAEVLFKIAYNLALEWCTSGFLDPYKQISLEYGKLLKRQNMHSKAREVFLSGWTKYRLGENLVQYIMCSKEANERYIPLFDIDDGLSKMPSYQGNMKYQVSLLCLKGDYLRHKGKPTMEFVSPWMEALHLDTEGKYMKGVLRYWGTWRRDSTNNASDRFIDYVQVLESHLQRQVKDAHDSGDEKQHMCGLIKLAEYFTIKLPQEQQKARSALEMALQNAQRIGDHQSSENIRKEIDLLTAFAEDVPQDPNELSRDLKTLRL